MTIGTLEINDAGLRLSAGNELLATSPAYAVLDNDRLMTGTEARQHAKLLPRWTNNRFWNQLGTEPLPNGTASIRHHADLAFAHLESLWQAHGDGIGQLVFAVPGFYSREQLGLLLGMARECGIETAGVVDTSVAAGAIGPGAETMLHLDIFLHRITLTVLKADSSLRHVETISISETGLFTLLDRWANIIAGQFIQTSRYDPMHQATSEQQLFDALPGWIGQRGSTRSSTFELNAGNTRHEVSITQEQLLQACATIYPQIVQVVRDKIPAGTSATLLVSDRFAGFPGLGDSLNLIGGADIHHLTAHAVTDAVSEHADSIVSKDGAVSHVTSLPVTRQQAPRPKAADTRPTHVLSGHHARAIGNALSIEDVDDNGIVTGERPAITLFERGGKTLIEIHRADDVLVNGERAGAGQVLTAGDTLSVKGHLMKLITVG